MTRILLLTVWMVVLVGEVTAARIVDNNDGTLTDSSTALMWQKTDDGVERVWDDALSYCESLELGDFDDWSLPKIHMLENLIEPSFSPTVNPVFSVKPSYYWSATESRNSVQSAKYVNFFYGNTYAFSKDNTYYAICVRDASDSIAEPLTISFVSDVKSKQPPFEVDFSSKILGGIEPYFYEWDFNDGDFSSLSNPSHTFKDPGEYNVVLTISDNNGAIAVAMGEVDALVIKEPEEMDITESADNVATSSPFDSVEPGDDNETAPIDSVDSASSDADTSPSEPPVVDIVETETDISASDSSQVVAEVSTEVDDNSIATNQEEEENVDHITEDIVVIAEQGEDGDNETATIKDSNLNSVAEAESENFQNDIGPEDEEESQIVEVDVIDDVVQEESVVPISNEDAMAEDVQIVVDAQDSIDSSYSEPTKSTKNLLSIFSSKDTAPVQVVSSGQGVLAYSFSNGMSGDADWNKDNKVTAKELKGYLGMAIENLSQGRQKAVMTVSDDDFHICAEEGVSHVLTIGVAPQEGGDSTGTPFATVSAESVALAVTQKCSSWKQLVLTGESAGRNNIFRALLKMSKNVAPEDNFIFYYAGESEGSEKGLNLFTNDTLTELPDHTGLLYEDLAGLLEEIEVKNLIMLFEVGPYVQ